MYTLPETELMKIASHTEDDRSGTYVLEPLYPGYGVTLGNSLRRVLLSSLEGSAISAVRIEGVTHEFATIPGMQEDVVELILNLKTLRLTLLDNEPTTLRLEKKGAGEIRAKDFTANSQVVVADPEHYLGTLDKDAKLSLEVLVSRGRGYVPTEQKKDEQHPLGTISIDSIFTPVKKVHYEVENTRVGGKTNYDKLTVDITTDGTIHPRAAFVEAAKILFEQFQIMTQVELPKDKKAAKKSKKDKEEALETAASDKSDLEEPMAEKAAKKTAKPKAPAKSKKATK